MGNWEFPVKRGFQNQMECGEYNLTFNHQTFILILYNSVPVLEVFRYKYWETSYSLGLKHNNHLKESVRWNFFEMLRWSGDFCVGLGLISSLPRARSEGVGDSLIRSITSFPSQMILTSQLTGALWSTWSAIPFPFLDFNLLYIGKIYARIYLKMRKELLRKIGIDFLIALAFNTLMIIP